MAAFALQAACTPSRDSVLKDVELNFTATGFLDTETFQVRCPLAEGEKRLEACDERLISELLAYKERYDREAFARRMHKDFLPFVAAAESTPENREKWRNLYKSIAEKRTRLVYERLLNAGFEGTYRLRAKDLIYRVQRAE